MPESRVERSEGTRVGKRSGTGIGARNSAIVVTVFGLLAASLASPMAMASHRYTYLVDIEQGHVFEPDHETTARLITPAGDDVADRTIDADGDEIGDEDALAPDVGDGGLILDSVVQYMTTQGGSYLAVNGYARSVSGGSTSFIFPGSSGLMAWFGHFTDHDSDMRIDDLCATDPRYGDGSADEFAWKGAASGEPGVYDVVAWIIPGNHSDELGDRPDLYAFPGLAVPDGSSGGASVDGLDGAYNMHPDFRLDDRSAGASNGGTHQVWPTGCPGNTGWVGGTGFGTNYADNALIRETTVVVGVFKDGVGRDVTLEQGYDLTAARFIDVDTYAAIHPTLDDLYLGIATSTRDNVTIANAIIYETADPLLEEARDRVPEPAFNETAEENNRFFPPAEHEPNHPLDVYPGASYGGDSFDGTCATDSRIQPKGSCNDYNPDLSGDTIPDGYGSDWHAWLDVQAYASGCICGTFIGGVYGPLKLGDNVPAGEPDRHSDRTFVPGHLYDFYGHAGQWFDKNGDTWIGEVRDPIEPYSRNLAATASNQDPNDYVDNDPSEPGSEFRGNCAPTQTPVRPRVVLEPLTPDGSWPGGLLRFNNFERVGLAALSGRPTVELYLIGPVEIPLECVAGEETTTGQLLARDYVSFPAAGVNYAVKVTATLGLNVLNGAGETVTETVEDVDVYYRV